MAGTLTFGPVTLQTGTHSFPPSGGSVLADSDSEAQLTVDRTIASGFNSLTSATAAFIEVEESLDGGNTWLPLASTTFLGGIFTVKPSLGGGTLNSNGFTITLIPGTNRLARATVQISGTAVAVQGSLVIS